MSVTGIIWAIAASLGIVDTLVPTLIKNLRNNDYFTNKLRALEAELQQRNMSIQDYISTLYDKKGQLNQSLMNASPLGSYFNNVVKEIKKVESEIVAKQDETKDINKEYNDKITDYSNKAADLADDYTAGDVLSSSIKYGKEIGRPIGDMFSNIGKGVKTTFDNVINFFKGGK